MDRELSRTGRSLNCASVGADIANAAVQVEPLPVNSPKARVPGTAVGDFGRVTNARRERKWRMSQEWGMSQHGRSTGMRSRVRGHDRGMSNRGAVAKGAICLALGEPDGLSLEDGER